MQNTKSAQKSKTSFLVLGYYVLMMVILGASDGLRGVFLPLFQDTFSLTTFQSSLIIMCSYVGNLLFLCIGGYFLDRISKKKFLLIVTLLWMSALLCYILTANYLILLICMIFSLGASTMLSTSLNVITPLLFAAPAMYINLFSFTNGIGIFSAQNIGGRVANNMNAWHIFNLVLLAGGVIGLLLLSRLHFPQSQKTEKSSLRQTFRAYGQTLKNPACKYLIFFCGFYCIIEHGIQNWIVTYGSEYLGFTRQRASLYLSIFFGGITVGRLVFAPLVQKLGGARSLVVFSGVGCSLYILGILLERPGMILLMISGLAFSILWPTTVLVIGTYYPPAQNGIAVGFITSMATFFDIAFNMSFGKLVERFGFAISIKILPVCALLYVLTFLMMRKRTVPYQEKI